MKKFSLLLSFVFLFAFSINASTRPSAAAQYAGGDGSASDPYQISNLSELLRFSTIPTSAADHKNTFFVLTANIDASETKDWTGNYPSLYQFHGNLDGQQFTIDSLCIRDSSFICYIDRLADAAGNTIGVNSGVIKNLGFSNIDALSATTGNAINKTFGGIVGFAKMTSVISRCFVTGSVIGSQNIGGIAGSAGQNAVIEDCYVRAVVIKINAPGLGNASGIVGASTGLHNVNRCYFAGQSRTAIFRKNGFTVNNADCFYDENSTIVDTDVDFTSLTTSQMADAASFTNWDFATVWEIGDEGYPVHRIAQYGVALDFDASLGAASGITDGTYPAGESFTLQAIPESGATFEGWYMNNVLVSSNANYSFTNAKEDVTVYAHFTDGNSIQDLYYYNDFNFTSELVLNARNSFATGWYGYQGGGNGSQVFGALEEINDETYQKIDWNADAIYKDGIDVADVEMEMSFQAISEAPGVDFLIRSSNTDRNVAINVVLEIDNSGGDSIYVKLNNGPILLKVGLDDDLVIDTEYLFKAVVKGSLLQAWVTTAGAAYPALPQLQYAIVGDEGFLSTGKFGFGVSDAEAARINYIKVGEPSAGTPTKVDDVKTNTLHIFPNPTSNMFTLKTLEEATVSIFDLNGKQVLSSILVENSANVSVATLNKGLYLVKATSKSGTKISKLVVN